MYEEDQTEEQQTDVEDRGDQVDQALLDDFHNEEGQEQETTQEAQGDDLDLDALKDLAGDDEKPRMVPHARFNEVNESLKAEREARLRLEEELARARGAGAVQPEAPADAKQDAGFDFEQADQRYTDALYEGDTEKARQIRAEIRAAERAEFERLAEEKAEARVMERLARQEQEQARSELEQVAAKITAKYSFLDSDSADADADAIGEVVALRDVYMARGDSPAEALNKAADRIAALNGVTGKPGSPSSNKLTGEQIQRNLEREQKIPPRDRGVGERANRIDYANLSDAEFEKLSDAEKAKARGDFIG